MTDFIRDLKYVEYLPSGTMPENAKRISNQIKYVELHTYGIPQIKSIYALSS